MDFLNFIIGLSTRIGFDVPEFDYGEIATVDGAVAYLATRVG